METSNQPTPRALDAQIAERVMGNPYVNAATMSDSQLAVAMFPHYSTSPADSRLVLERMRRTHCITIRGGNGWRCKLDSYASCNHDGDATHESLDMAICLSALAAVGQGEETT